MDKAESDRSGGRTINSACYWSETRKLSSLFRTHCEDKVANYIKGILPFFPSKFSWKSFVFFFLFFSILSLHAHLRNVMQKFEIDVPKSRILTQCPGTAQRNSIGLRFWKLYRHIFHFSLVSLLISVYLLVFYYQIEP